MPQTKKTPNIKNIDRKDLARAYPEDFGGITLGNIDPKTILDFNEPAWLTPLGQICLQIIDANPDREKRSRYDRLAIAMSALLGRAIPVGRKSAELDDLILIAIAQQYFSLLFKDPFSSIDLAPIIRECVKRISPRPPSTTDNWNSVVRRLRNKFFEYRDLLSPHVRCGRYPDQLSEVSPEEIVSCLSHLGVRIALRHEQATDETPGY